MRDQPLAFIDTETTGLSTERHEIIEIGCVMAVQMPRLGAGAHVEMKSEHEWKVLPRHIETADPEALRINNYDPADWKDAVPLKQALEELAAVTEGAIMVGHNVGFDYAFLEKAFQEEGVENKMHYHKLDTISLAYARLFDNLDVQKFSLRNLTAHFSITNSKAHSALSDARATYELYKKIFAL